MNEGLPETAATKSAPEAHHLAIDHPMISATGMLTASAPETFAARDSSDTVLKEQCADSDEVPHSRSPVEAELLPWILGPLIALATAVVPLATVLGSRQHRELPPTLSADGGEQNTRHDLRRLSD